MEKTSKIYVAWHRGLVGSAILRRLKKEWYSHLITRTHSELDLLDAHSVNQFFEEEKPEYIFLAAAKVGGINANNVYPAEFIYQNLQIQNSVIHNAHLHGVKKLMFLWSVCIYPKLSQQPIKEEYLLSGKLEPTNAPYAIAKIAGINMCNSYNRQYGTNFISVMPTNLYGPHDNFDLEKSHVLPAMIRKFHEAKENDNALVTLWWTGNPTRELMYSDDMAEGCLYLMLNMNVGDFSGDLCNLGVGKDISIRDLAKLVQEIVGHKWIIEWDTSKPDWTPVRVLDVSQLTSLGWKAQTDLKEGIINSYNWFRKEWPKTQ